MVDILDYVKLSNAAVAIRVCHDTIISCDSVNDVTGIKDKELIKRVGVKMKHASTLEHLRFTFGIKRIFDINVNNKVMKLKLDNIIELLEFFKNNKYNTTTTSDNDEHIHTYIISTNMRVIVEHYKLFDLETLISVLPEEYVYLIEEKEE